MDGQIPDNPITEKPRTLTPQEFIPGNESEFGLQLEHADSRRQIYSIVDVPKFLSKSVELGIGFLSSKLNELFAEYPEGLKQFFIATPQGNGEVKLGNHYHTPMQEGGSGDEIFVITDVQPGASLSIEQVNLGRNSGTIRPLNIGGVAVINPYGHHIIRAKRPFSMIQILENQKFNSEDLKQFQPKNFSPEDERSVKGTL